MFRFTLDYLTQRVAAARLGIHPTTFTRRGYRRRLLTFPRTIIINGVAWFHRDDVDAVNAEYWEGRCGGIDDALDLSQQLGRVSRGLSPIPDQDRPRLPLFDDGGDDVADG